MTTVLLSAGLDSAVLAAAEARTGRVQPIYVSAGLAWEAREIAALERLLRAPLATPATKRFSASKRHDYLLGRAFAQS